MTVDRLKVKAESEAIVRRLGGMICDWLPVHSDGNKPRTQDELIARALVMNALLNIAFRAPIPVIKRWIGEHGLTSYLSPAERAVLEKSNEQLTAAERANLYWQIEGLWALLWAGGLVAELDPMEGVPDTMAALCPNLQRGENGAKFRERMRLRPYEELYSMVDLHLRLHWWSREEQLSGRRIGAPSQDITMARRKALEWLLDDQSDWDDIDLST